MRNLKSTLFQTTMIALAAIGMTSGATAQTAVALGQNKMTEVSRMDKAYPRLPLFDNKRGGNDFLRRLNYFQSFFGQMSLGWYFLITHS